MRVKRPGRKVDLSPPSSAEVKNEWKYTSSPSIRLNGVDKDSFTLFTFLLHILSSLFSDLTSAVHIDLYRLSRHFSRVPATTQAVIVSCDESRHCVHFFFRSPGHDSFHPAIVVNPYPANVENMVSS